MSESEPTTPKRSLRPLFIALAVVVPLVPILIAVVMGGSGGSAAVLTNAVTVPAPKFALATAATQSPTSAPKTVGLQLPPGHGSLVALLRHATALHAKPGGRVLGKLALKTAFGSPQAMWVVRHSGRWLGV